MFFVHSTEKSAFLLDMYHRLKTVFLRGGQKPSFCIHNIYYNMFFYKFSPVFFHKKNEKKRKKV